MGSRAHACPSDAKHITSVHVSEQVSLSACVCTVQPSFVRRSVQTLCRFSTHSYACTHIDTERCSLLFPTKFSFLWQFLGFEIRYEHTLVVRYPHTERKRAILIFTFSVQLVRAEEYRYIYIYLVFGCVAFALLVRLLLQYCCFYFYCFARKVLVWNVPVSSETHSTT